ncbi:hypothetical protein BDW59DRAFT_164113 [Aspergillus cavernicola]|uniref:Uncharacterized protein n=1 Tax=Aspergillus cavernicola TaxID=176166 RepID=A0ABR4I247_9EURO
MARASSSKTKPRTEKKKVQKSQPTGKSKAAKPVNTAEATLKKRRKAQKKPKAGGWPAPLRKAIFEKKGFTKKQKPKALRNTARWWDSRRRLLLFMHIARYKQLSLTEFEWRDIADMLGRTWNGIRLEYSSLMGGYFPDFARGARKANKNKRKASAPAQSTLVDNLNPKGFRRRRSSRLNERTERLAYRTWKRWRRAARIKGFKRFY